VRSDRSNWRSPSCWCSPDRTAEPGSSGCSSSCGSGGGGSGFQPRGPTAGRSWRSAAQRPASSTAAAANAATRLPNVSSCHAPAAARQPGQWRRTATAASCPAHAAATQAAGQHRHDACNVGQHAAHSRAARHAAGPCAAEQAAAQPPAQSADSPAAPAACSAGHGRPGGAARPAAAAALARGGAAGVHAFDS